MFRYRPLIATLIGVLLLIACARVARPTSTPPTPSAITPRVDTRASTAPATSIPIPTLVRNTQIVSPSAAAERGSGAQANCSPTPPGPTQTTPIDDAPIRNSVGHGHVLKGVVKSSRDCAPIANAEIIFWLTNLSGEYDADHRAKVFTDSAGAYQFESNYPAPYARQPVPHIHLYASAAGYKDVEQEYFPSGKTEGVFDLILEPSAR